MTKNGIDPRATQCPDDYGHCPHCGADFNGPRIWRSINESHGQVKADRWAATYGATPEHGRFTRIIAETGTPPGTPTIYRCPDCMSDVSDLMSRLHRETPSPALDRA